jgi:hemerythrin superfamily protein
MEPGENELELEEEFLNRTGIMTNPQMSAELLQGTEELALPADGDAGEIAEMRAEYLAEAPPIGSDPIPVSAGAEDDESSEPTPATRVLLDKLGERLAFERQGTRLYEAFLQKFESLGLEEEGGPKTADIRHICDEEFEHFRMLQQAIVKLGGDATVKTPCADVAGVLSKGAVEIIADPRTTLPQCLQALLTAELVDNDGWAMLSQLANRLELEELETQCRTALDQEQDHLEKVRQWLLSATLETVQGGSETLAEMEAEETEEQAEAPDVAVMESGATDPLELLKQDHEKVKELFEQAEASEDDKEKRKIFKEIKKALETHTRVEETIFYPAMQEFDELEEMVLEAIEEHKQVKKLLREIDKLGKTSDKFEPKLKVLQENVEHHAEEEEEGKMFPKIRAVVDSAQLQELGSELEAAKNKRQRKAS